MKTMQNPERDGLNAQGEWTEPSRRPLVRALGVIAIGALCLAALVAVVIFLLGDFGETEGRLLGTALSVAGYSLLGMAASTMIGRQPRWLGSVGLGVSAAGFCLMVTLIWTTPEGDVLGRVTGSVLIAAVTIAHAALLLLLRVDSPWAGLVRRAAIVATTILATMITAPILFALEPEEYYLRWLGVVAVFAVLGTLLVPILRKFEGPIATAGPLRAIPVFDGDDERWSLEFRYSGRQFVAKATRQTLPGEPYKAKVWEVTSSGRAPVELRARGGIADDPYEVLALAVLQMCRIVDGAEGAGGYGARSTRVASPVEAGTV